MKTKQTTEIKVETHEVTVIRVHQKQARSIFCTVCREQTSHITVSHAAAALSISESSVFRLAESGAVHSIEDAAGALLVCGGSLCAMPEEIGVSSEESLNK